MFDEDFNKQYFQIHLIIKFLNLDKFIFTYIYDNISSTVII